MSCNGCRVLRKGCSETCMLRSCLLWIDTPEAQGHATLFLAKFFGRSDLLSFIAAVPQHQRPALFQSLLFEACGRTVNPVDGAVGLLSSGNWHVCRAAVETVLSGGTLIRPTAPAATAMVTGPKPNSFDKDEGSPPAQSNPSSDGVMTGKRGRGRSPAMSFYSDTTDFQSNKRGGDHHQDKKLLNLFV